MIRRGVVLIVSLVVVGVGIVAAGSEHADKSAEPIGEKTPVGEGAGSAVGGSSTSSSVVSPRNQSSPRSPVPHPSETRSPDESPNTWTELAARHAPAGGRKVGAGSFDGGGWTMWAYRKDAADSPCFRTRAAWSVQRDGLIGSSGGGGKCSGDPLDASGFLIEERGLMVWSGTIGLEAVRVLAFREGSAVPEVQTLSATDLDRRYFVGIFDASHAPDSLRAYDSNGQVIATKDLPNPFG